MTIRTLSAFCVALCAVLPALAQPVGAGIGGRLAEDFIRPSLADFEDATADLHRSMQGLCAAPTSERLAAVRQSFGETIEVFGRVSVLRFGPLAAENRFERLFFWPDARGVTLRQVQELLAEEGESALTSEGFVAKSVAVQGLPALEYVLFGTGSDWRLSELKTYRCRYGEAIAGNVAGLASAIAQAWMPQTGFARSFTTPSPERDPYRSDQEVAGELVKVLGTGLQFVREAELLPAIGDDLQRARGRRAPFWRSDLTFTFVGAQIEGLAALLASANLDASLEGAAGSNLDAIAFDLEHAAEAISEVDKTVETAFADDEDHEKIRYATVALNSAQQNVNGRLSADLGLTMGFNALDGD